ncbi:uncharacterized protein LOC110225720 [Arabidopsis lyrata subsp. lyrata]|uniref:uncharacterized protein LOC110225720 n=1 Tax=Arabidopsis lyrata subsp. lyrata TaxID=81972 RepID=UPI000A29E432|nr:uncharacterized protein LOC110225720 [Arabidopsis lyrata subsp. lyrata]|eukprot:XP_020871343.1 uncharacterized protein LOC110225720 [Arabidopsis lyrata subsp. lyrata]
MESDDFLIVYFSYANGNSSAASSEIWPSVAGKSRHDRSFPPQVFQSLAVTEAGLRECQAHLKRFVFYELVVKTHFTLSSTICIQVQAKNSVDNPMYYNRYLQLQHLISQAVDSVGFQSHVSSPSLNFSGCVDSVGFQSHVSSPSSGKEQIKAACSDLEKIRMIIPLMQLGF